MSLSPLDPTAFIGYSVVVAVVAVLVSRREGVGAGKFRMVLPPDHPELPWLAIFFGGLSGLVLTALIAAIMSSLDSMLNSTATIFTVDVCQRHLKPDSSQPNLITVGRASTVASLLVAWAWAQFLVSFERIFSYIQEFWGLITPGVAVVFLSGLFWKRATARGAVWVMGLTLPFTVGIKGLTPGAAFLDQMSLAGIVLFALPALLSVGAVVATVVLILILF